MTQDIVSHIAQLRKLIAGEGPQFLILLGLSLGIVACAAAAHRSDRGMFRKFFGQWNPVIVVVFVVLLGGSLLTYLLSRGWFAIYRAGNPSRFVIYSGLAVAFGLVMILVDRQGVFGEDINALFPQSLFFYPTMGYVAEVIFSILPLTLLLVLLTSLSDRASFSAVVWPCIVIVSLLEPVFQVAPNVGEYPLWASIYVGLHVMAINAIQLALFKRFDFVTMYVFRIAYYVVWHIVWGHVRLSVLF